MKKIIILRGHQGSGKSTYAKELFNKFKAEYNNALIYEVSYDDILVKENGGEYIWTPENITNAMNIACISEMNECLIELWNSTVKSEDIVYNMGDLSLISNVSKIIDVAKRLNGKHFLILGNHDYPIKRKREDLINIIKDDGNRLFEDIRDYKFLRLPEGKFALSHYPMAGWEDQQHGSIMLHGHLHDFMTNIRGKILNVGFDLHGKILSIKDVLEFVKQLPITPYRDESNSSMDAIRSQVDIGLRKELIVNRLKDINL